MTAKPTRPRVQRHVTLWDLDPTTVICRRKGRHEIEIDEDLDVDLSRRHQPYCCYANTVIFYETRKFGRVEVARRNSVLGGGISPELYWWDGQWWELRGGRVIFSRGRWIMRHKACDNSGAARAVNFGWALKD